MASGYGKGRCLGTLGSAWSPPRSPAAPVVGASSGHCPASGGSTGWGGGGKNSNREGKGAKALPGEAEGRQGKGGLQFLFIVLLSPDYTEGKQPQSKGYNTREEVFLSLDNPRSFGYGLPLPAWDGETELSAPGGAAGTDPRGSGAQHRPSHVTGRRVRSSGLGSPLPHGADFIFHAAPSLCPPSPFDNPQLLLFFPSAY